MAHDVFISYSSKDKLVADAACAVLESKGIRCWIAPRDVMPGMDWGSSIINAIIESRVMVLIFSSSANGSVQIKREVNHAIDKEVAVIPFRIEDVMPSGAMEYYLDVTHWLDALTQPLEQHLEELASDVNLLLKRTDASPTASPSKSDVASSPPRSDVSQPKRNPLQSRAKLLLIGGVVAAILIAVLATVLIIRNRTQPVQNAEAQTGERWFVILGTFEKNDTDGANHRLEQVKAKGFEARIVNTDDYSNFAPNKLAIMLGPYSENMARRMGSKASESTGIIPTVKPGW